MEMRDFHMEQRLGRRLKCEVQESCLLAITLGRRVYDDEELAEQARCRASVLALRSQKVQFKVAAAEDMRFFDTFEQIPCQAVHKTPR
jgi:hypothetical protein